MTMSRGDLDRRAVDVADVANDALVPAVHPDTILGGVFSRPLELSVYRLTQDLRISREWLNHIAMKRHSVTTNTALRLRRCHGAAPEYRTSLQT